MEKESLQSAVVEIEEVRCDVNADFTEKLADSERFDEGRFWKQRRDFEKKWRDPDDVYIDVQRREEERKKQGLPHGRNVVFTYERKVTMGLEDLIGKRR